MRPIHASAITASAHSSDDSAVVMENDMSAMNSVDVGTEASAEEYSRELAPRNSPYPSASASVRPLTKNRR